MQRQDDYLINRTAMLLFIMQMTSLAGLAFRIAAQNRPVDDLLLRSFIRSEHVMLMLLAGIWGNVDTRGSFPGLDEFDAPPASACRRAELLSIGASFQQIAMALALLLAMHPRAFRDRHRLSRSSFRGGAAEPGIQRRECCSLAPTALKRGSSSTLDHSIYGFRMPLRGSGMTASSAARAPP
jgi:hypothetical protein